MNTKEAIEFLEHNDGVNFNWRGNFKYIVALLKRGEKYEEMWGNLKSIITTQKDIYIPEEYRSHQGGSLEYLMKKVEEGYFPKIMKKTITIEFESGSKDLIDRTIQLLKNGVIEGWYSGLVKVNIKEE